MASKPIHPAEAALAEADASFAATGNSLEALDWVRLAAKAGLPLPPAIAAWLAAGIDRFRAEDASLDEALGLRGSGKADPRRARREISELQGRLARISVLHGLGAKIEDAALMVSRLGPEFTPGYLTKRFRRDGWGERARANRRELRDLYHLTTLRELLAEYPDRPPEIKRIKASILAMYSKVST